jgi:hypothetical protein
VALRGPPEHEFLQAIDEWMAIMSELEAYERESYQNTLNGISDPPLRMLPEGAPRPFAFAIAGQLQ